MTQQEKSHIIKIFLADDHAVLRDAFKSLLSEEEAIEVVGEADDGKEAVERVAATRPDIVIMDIGMPVLNGVEATRRIKQQNPGIKVLILSGYEGEQYLYRVVQAGAHGYLVKSVEADTLFNAIEAVQRGEYVFPKSVLGAIQKEIDNLKHPGQGNQSDSFHKLTDREREILQLIGEGKTHQQIAELLQISVRTVDTHRNNIIKKLDVHDTANLVLYAIRNGITTIP